MKIPFYYNSNDFELSYESDLKLFQSEYDEATEKDYLQEILKTYHTFVDIEDGIFKFIKKYDILQYTPKYIDYEGGYWEDDYTQVSGDINFYLDCVSYNHQIQSINPFEDITDEQFKKFYFNSKFKHEQTHPSVNPVRTHYEFNDNIHYHLFNFFYTDGMFIKLKTKEYFNFSFAVIKIVTFIKDKLTRNDLINNNISTPSNNRDIIVDYPTNNDDILKNEIDIDEIFSLVRTGNIAQSSILKLLKKYTDNFDSEITKSVLKDLEFYLYIEKIEIEEGFTFLDIDNEIKSRVEKGLEVPHKEIKLPNSNGDASITNRSRLDVEELMYPFEFFTLYQLKNLLKDKLQETDTDNSNSKLLSSKDILKIRLLHETGIINFLTEKYPNASTNQIAKFFELISDTKLLASSTNSKFTTGTTNVKYPLKNLTPTQKSEISESLIKFSFIKE